MTSHCMYTMCKLLSCTLRCRLAIAQAADEDRKDGEGEDAKATGTKGKAKVKSKSRAMKRPAACDESEACGSPAKKKPPSQDEKDDPAGPTPSDLEDDKQPLSQDAKPKRKSKSKTKTPKADPDACAGEEEDEFVALRDRVKNNKFQALFDTVPPAIQAAFKEACKCALCQSSHMLCECLIFCRCVVKTYLLIVFNNKHAVCT